MPAPNDGIGIAVAARSDRAALIGFVTDAASETALRDGLLDAAPGEWSACVWDARGNQRFGYQQHVARSSASLIKVPIALVLYDAPSHLLDERVALREGSLVVNSSQGGGVKDTWVLSE